jgi:hypothetical protein
MAKLDHQFLPHFNPILDNFVFHMIHVDAFYPLELLPWMKWSMVIWPNFPKMYNFESFLKFIESNF